MSKPLPRYPLPEKPGVYFGSRPDELSTITVQLAEDGTWWPFPYSYSGWRASELTLFRLKPLSNRAPDVPEIRNPDDAAAIEALSQRLVTLLGVPQASAAASARQLILREGWSTSDAVA